MYFDQLCSLLYRMAVFPFCLQFSSNYIWIYYSHSWIVIIFLIFTKRSTSLKKFCAFLKCSCAYSTNFYYEFYFITCTLPYFYLPFVNQNQLTLTNQINFPSLPSHNHRSHSRNMQTKTHTNHCGTQTFPAPIFTPPRSHPSTILCTKISIYTSLSHKPTFVYDRKQWDTTVFNPQNTELLKIVT